MTSKIRELIEGCNAQRMYMGGAHLGELADNAAAELQEMEERIQSLETALAQVAALRFRSCCAPQLRPGDGPMSAIRKLIATLDPDDADAAEAELKELQTRGAPLPTVVFEENAKLRAQIAEHTRADAELLEFINTREHAHLDDGTYGHISDECWLCVSKRWAAARGGK